MIALRQHMHSCGLALCLMAASGAQSFADGDAGLSLPPELLVDGKPVEPYCMEHFFGDSSRFEPVNVRDCLQDNPYENEGKIVHTKNGEYGREFDFAGIGSPYIFYQYIGQKSGKPVLLLKENGGGTGHFTSLVVLKREGDTLKLVEEISGGDRCNGGVIETSIVDGTVSFTQNITPYDFVELSGSNPHGIVAYDDLESSAGSCYGEATYENGKLKSIALKATAEDAEGWTDNITYQACFNELYRNYRKQGKDTLSKDELHSFVHNFNTTCVDQPTQSE